MLPENEQTLLDQAIDAVYREAGLRLEIMEYERADGKLRMDAILGVRGYEPLQFAAEIKKWAQHVNFGAVVAQIKNLPMKGILVADYINPKMAEKLKEEDIQFIDTVGNAYIKADPLLIYVKGNRQKYRPKIGKLEKNRAFTTTGLKVVYAFLCNPDLVRAPYREIAEFADVAHGTVGWVITDLKGLGYLVDRGNKKNRRINQYQKLLDRWVENYPETLKRKQFLGNFEATDPYWWKNFDITKYEGYWGGEVAAAKYTQYLKPEIATIYLPKITKGLMFNDARLRKNPMGNVKIYQTFWKNPEHYEYTGYVNPVLVYADLIATGDVRNIETAKIIFEDHIARYINEY